MRSTFQIAALINVLRNVYYKINGFNFKYLLNNKSVYIRVGLKCDIRVVNLNKFYGS